MQGHSERVTTVTKTRDNKYIVSGSDDKTIRIWNILQKTQESVLQGHTSSVLTLAVTSDNKYIVSSSKDNKIRIWKLLNKLQKHFNLIIYSQSEANLLKKFFIVLYDILNIKNQYIK